MADVMLVTPFSDGMNLVAKEYVAAHFGDGGVLVLSEFAGAAHELSDAILVNPFDINTVKNAIVRALEMPEGEQEARMRSLGEAVKGSTVTAWATSFIDCLID